MNRIYIKVCEICGKQYESKGPTRRICYEDHYRTCPDCGKDVLWNSTAEFHGCKSCNQQRAVAKRRATLLERYGVSDVFKSAEFRAKAQQTNQLRYGVDNAMQSPQIQQKARATCKVRYGVENPAQAPDVRRRIQATRSAHQGEITAKIQQTLLERYGVDNPMRVPAFVDKIATTMIERYGVKSAAQVPEFLQKMIETTRARYGVDFYVQTSECIKQAGTRISTVNKQIGSQLSALGFDVTYEYVIDRRSYDIAILDQHILIEVDPTYTHNSAQNHWEDSGIDKQYHAEKSALAESHGFRCIHIFDWDDIHKLIDTLQATSVLYARKCSIREVASQDANQFLDLYHLQRSCKGSIYRVGLYHDNQLVQLMTFGKPRYNKNYHWELLRLCTAGGITVVGGASKLFKYCVTKYSLDNIISYCDKAKFTGKVYEQIGMQYQYTSTPNVHWSKGHDHISGSLLRQRGYDQLFNTNYGKGTSNDELMLQAGWLPVYDCGQAVYTYKSQSQSESSDTSVEIIDYDDLLKQREERKKLKKCAYCGEEFHANSPAQIYCKRPHYQICPICGKSVLVTNNEKLKNPPTACSYACRVEQTRRTCQEKYGVDSPGAIPPHLKKH